jgi:acyl-CoA synthetase (AMP-forming)/AMP-acid ligase II
MGIESLLDEAVDACASRPALFWGSDVLTYDDLGGAVDRLALRLRETGVGSGTTRDRIAIIAPNVPALVIAMFAVWRVGATAVPLNARLREHELARTLADAEARLTLSVRSHLGYSFEELAQRLATELPALQAWWIVDSLAEIEQILPGPHGPSAAQQLDDSVAALLYTSGTTGLPKGALVRHVRELETSRYLARALGLTHEDAAAFVVPVSHAFGLTCLLATIGSGGSAALVDASRSVEPLLDAVERQRASILHGSPSVFTSVLKARPEGIPTLRAGFVAGAPSPPGMLEELERTGTSILNVYGLTETGAVSCCLLHDPPDVRAGTAGRALPRTELRIAGENADGVGELQVRGPYVTPGYYGASERSAEGFEDEWFRTGDLATIDDRGYLRIAGRIKELAHVGGFNVFPAEVEGVLLAHPDVAQAAVVAVPDERMGEALQAFVVARPGAEVTPAALLRFARPRIAGYKLPYEIRILSDLPLLPSGKPDRLALAELAPVSRLG